MIQLLFLRFQLLYFNILSLSFSVIGLCRDTIYLYKSIYSFHETYFLKWYMIHLYSQLYSKQIICVTHMCHEACRSNRSGSRIRDGIDVSSMRYKAFYNFQVSRYCGAPQRGDTVYRSVVRYFILSSLFDVCVAFLYEILDDFYVVPLAGDEQWGTTILYARHNFLPHFPLIVLQTIPQRVSELRPWYHIFAFVNKIVK